MYCTRAQQFQLNQTATYIYKISLLILKKINVKMLVTFSMIYFAFLIDFEKCRCLIVDIWGIWFGLVGPMSDGM